MTTTVFLTGDRSQGPMPAAQITAIVINQIVAQTNDETGIRFVTGNLESGIERAVRYLIPSQALKVVNYDVDEEGRVQFESAFASVAGEVDKTVVIHTDPLNSRLAKAAIVQFKDVEFPLEAVLNSAPDDASSLLGDEKAPE